MINYTISRSNRKTIALHIKNGSLEVRAPLHASKANIDKFVHSKSSWIEKHLSQSAERAEKRESFTLNYGSTITYRGREYPIYAKEGSRVGFDGSVFYMPPNLSPERIKDACEQIYRILAKNTCTEKVLAFAKQMSVMPIAVKVNGATTRWGSCSGKKSLNFSWRLVMADDDVIDYVVVHELAHITEMNHSEKFWAIVAGVLPDYRERQKRLKELQKRLSTESWE